MDTFEIYTPLSVALSEIERRRRDTKLVEKVTLFFKDYPTLPELQNGPRIVFSPTLITPNLELEYFLDIVTDLPFKPIFYEYTDDKFVHLNPIKFNLGHMTFFHRFFDGKRKTVVGSVRVVDFNLYQGKPLSMVKTTSGEPLIAFHHRLLNAHFKDYPFEIHDFSKWFRNSYSFDPQYCYLRYLGLFMTDAILFGHFNTSKTESQFTCTKVLPAFQKLKEIFGIVPLIVPLQALETENDSFWCYYSDTIRDLL